MQLKRRQSRAISPSNMIPVDYTTVVNCTDPVAMALHQLVFFQNMLSIIFLKSAFVDYEI